MQCKGNFREQCLKDFGGEMYDKVADTADDIYNNMDPPTASLQPKSNTEIHNAQQFQQAMNNFNDDDDGGYYGGGCFHGNCTIEMHDGSTKPVHTLQKGD